MGIGAAIARRGLWFPSQPAVIDRGTTYTYSALNDRINRLANLLRASRCGLGDRVLVLADNRVACIDALGATSKTGTILVVANPRWKSFEIADLMNRTTPRVIIVDAEVQQLLAGADCLSEARVLVYGGETGSDDYETCLTQSNPAEHIQAAKGTDLAAMTFTGGTTDTPKGVLYDADRMMIGASFMGSRFGYDLHPAATFFLLYPLASVGALNVSVIPCLANGATLILEPQRGFDPERFASVVRQYQVTHTQMVPTMLFRLLDAPSTIDPMLKSLQLVGFGSAPTPTERIAELVKRFGPLFMQAYGQSEAGGVTHSMPRELIGKLDSLANSCGLPFSGVDVRIVDRAGTELESGDVGEILLRSPYQSRGFWQDEVQTAATFRNGWVHTGDLGLIDEQGYLHLSGRTKDVIMSGGFKVAATEVESILYRHPAVAEAAVVGVPDAEWGEIVQAFVSLKSGATVTPAELQEHCRNTLAGYKCPRTVEIREQLPKSPMGKILKRELTLVSNRGERTGS